MICKEYACVFVHIPKTAGQSIESFFLNLLGMTWEERSPLLLRYNKNPNLGPERLAHLTSEEYAKYAYLEEEEFKQYFKFSFVRNPYARIVSEYHYKKYDQNLSFKDFLKFNLPQYGFSNDYRHILPQYDFLYSQEDSLLVDFIGKFERLQSDFDLICSKLGIEESELPHRNMLKSTQPKNKLMKLLTHSKSKKRPHYSTYYDSESKSIVDKLYEKDIATFKYEFGE